MQEDAEGGRLLVIEMELDNGSREMVFLSSASEIDSSLSLMTVWSRFVIWYNPEGGSEPKT
jgi:hypothetical protein